MAEEAERKVGYLETAGDRTMLALTFLADIARAIDDGHIRVAIDRLNAARATTNMSVALADLHTFLHKVGAMLPPPPPGSVTFIAPTAFDDGPARVDALRKACKCLYIAVDSAVALDVNARAEAVIEMLAIAP